MIMWVGARKKKCEELWGFRKEKGFSEKEHNQPRLVKGRKNMKYPYHSLEMENVCWAFDKNRFNKMDQQNQ